MRKPPLHALVRALLFVYSYASRQCFLVTAPPLQYCVVGFQTQIQVSPWLHSGNTSLPRLPGWSFCDFPLAYRLCCIARARTVSFLRWR